MDDNAMHDWEPNRNPAELIDWFDDFLDTAADGFYTNEYSFLSNFYLHPITINEPSLGLFGTYPSTEHAYAAAKAMNVSDHNRIRDAATPGEAKRLGRETVLTPHWEDGLKVLVMNAVLRVKFSDPELGGRLCATGRAKLVEGTLWNDRIWGVDLQAFDGELDPASPHPAGFPGANLLGKLLMFLRSDLQSGR